MFEQERHGEKARSFIRRAGNWRLLIKRRLFYHFQAFIAQQWRVAVGGGKHTPINTEWNGQCWDGQNTRGHKDDNNNKKTEVKWTVKLNRWIQLCTPGQDRGGRKWTETNRRTQVDAAGRGRMENTVLEMLTVPPVPFYPALSTPLTTTCSIYLCSWCLIQEHLVKLTGMIILLTRCVQLEQWFTNCSWQAPLWQWQTNCVCQNSLTACVSSCGVDGN